jgi:hypothetical protein
MYLYLRRKHRLAVTPHSVDSSLPSALSLAIEPNYFGVHLEEQVGYF